MKRAATWLMVLIGVLAVAWLAAYFYIMLTAPRIKPGDPIEIYRDPDAPSYSMAAPPARA